ncbi:hypothetical protein [Teichococcus aestuarii]|uniref:hypothetical protein n=1 Tax=Teichococcus aestuarii TaxID=568898 RepID=UPI00360CF256
MSATFAGIALQLVAIAFFVAMDTTIKLMTADYAVSQLIFARFAFHILFVALLLRVFTGPLPWRSRALGLQAARSLCRPRPTSCSPMPWPMCPWPTRRR